MPPRQDSGAELTLGPHLAAAMIPRTVEWLAIALVLFGGYIAINRMTALIAMIGNTSLITYGFGGFLFLITWIIVIYHYMTLSKTKYEFFRNEMEISEGLVSVTKNTVAYNSITDVSFDRSIYHSIFETGVITLDTSGSRKAIQLEYIKNPEEKYNQIRDLLWADQREGQSGQETDSDIPDGIRKRLEQEMPSGENNGNQKRRGPPR
jgi:membrane protein YdbS with pleckstrin-like domain